MYHSSIWMRQTFSLLINSKTRDVSERWLFILDITKLITALRTAVENGEGSLDKEATSHDDLMDAFRMSMLSWH